MFPLQFSLSSSVVLPAMLRKQILPLSLGGLEERIILKHDWAGRWSRNAQGGIILLRLALQLYFIRSTAMWREMLQAKYLPFSTDSATVIKGQIPASLEGRLYRNQPAIFGVSQHRLSHWFQGNGSILSLAFNKGTCSAKFQNIETPLFNYINTKHRFQLSFFEKVYKKVLGGYLDFNPANTSVYPIPNSPHLLALCEGGSPFIMRKDTLESIDFSLFGSIAKGYSAHPKIDPDTGIIYNIGSGSTPKELHLYAHTANLQLIKTSHVTLRDYHAIHDVALAGNYLVVIESPNSLDVLKLMMGQSYFRSLNYVPEKYQNLIHVFDKNSLERVAQFEAQPFMLYHFVNGYSEGKEVVVEFLKYDSENNRRLNRFLLGIADLVFDKKTRVDPWRNHVSKMTLDLSDKTLKVEEFSSAYTSQFPVVADQQVGKPWRYSYHAISEAPSENHDSVGIYDQQTRSFCKVFRFGKECNVSEPVLIQQKGNKYLLPIVYDGRHFKSYAVLLSAVDLSEICVIELPGVVPLSFHGRWDGSRVSSN